jgi:hypothetical protein
MIRAVKFGLFLTAALLAAGCTMSQPPTRGQAGVQDLLPANGTGIAVQRVDVWVPRSLSVSEANTLKPAADIVWHGEAYGDRHAQVQRIVQNAALRAAAPFAKGHPVVVDVQVLRFHALTPKTRQSFGGKHDLFYALTIRDAATGAVLHQSERVDASVRAAGGAKAQAEEAMGRSQEVVIDEALAASIYKALEQPRMGGAGAGMVAQSAANPARAGLP